MLGENAPDIQLGSVIYGRVSGYPWWPAVVDKCPSTNQWTKGGKFWVYFFNDTNGAWLKASQIRSFDRYNGDLCQEHNSGVAKFRRYQDRIDKAVSIAEKHLSRASKPIRVKVLPPSKSRFLDDASRSAPSSQEHYENNRTEKVTASRRNGNLKPPLFDTTTKESRANGAPPSQNLPHNVENQSEMERVGTNDIRPKRKRMRSIRYIDHDSTTAGSSRRKELAQLSVSPQIYPAAGSADKSAKLENHGCGDGRRDDSGENKLQIQRRSLRLRRSTALPESGVYNGKRSRRKRVRSLPHDAYREQEGDNAKLSTLESCASLDIVRGEPACQQDQSPFVSNDLHEHGLTSNTRRVVKEEPEVSLRKHMFVAELKQVITKSKEENKCRVDGTRRPSRVRSLVGVASRPEGRCMGIDDWTDSEERPERERKVTLGSLEAAAEDLVECAINGSRSDSSNIRGNAAGGAFIPFSNSDLVSSILNRLSNLEKDIKLLKKRTTSEDRATLGEDATAAGVKSAVEALASASLAFAKARNYNVTAIRRSMEMLWPDQDLPLAGADGDLLRTVAQSLILASCKRRDAEIASAALGAQDDRDTDDEIAERRHRKSPECSSSVLENGDVHNDFGPL